jgi:hypothetical protein
MGKFQSFHKARGGTATDDRFETYGRVGCVRGGNEVVGACVGHIQPDDVDVEPTTYTNETKHRHGKEALNSKPKGSLTIQCDKEVRKR